MLVNWMKSRAKEDETPEKRPGTGLGGWFLFKLPKMEREEQ